MNEIFLIEKIKGIIPLTKVAQQREILSWQFTLKMESYLKSKLYKMRREEAMSIGSLDTGAKKSDKNDNKVTTLVTANGDVTKTSKLTSKIVSTVQVKQILQAVASLVTSGSNDIGDDMTLTESDLSMYYLKPIITKESLAMSDYKSKYLEKNGKDSDSFSS